MHDLSLFLNEDYKSIGNNSKDKFLEHFTKFDFTTIGYPRTESYDYLNKGHDLNFQNNVLKELIDMDDPKIRQSIKDDVEVIVKFPNSNSNSTKNEGNAEIHLKKKENVAKERKELFENDFKSKVLEPNVFILFLLQHFLSS